MTTRPDLPTNWGRWGEDDELGTLNHITIEARARGARTVQTGRAVSLAHPIQPVLLAGGGPVAGGMAMMPTPVLQMLNYNPTPPAYVDLLLLNCHNITITHIDAPVHVPVDGKIYPGVPVEEAVRDGRALRGTTSAYAPGICTRGVLLDLVPGGRLDPAHPVGPADFEAAEQRAGFTVQSGDAIVVRGGWVIHDWLHEPLPGVTLEAVRWLADREVALYLGDIGDRPPGNPEDIIPLHYVALARLGLPLIDNAAVEELARVCAELGRWEFMLTIGPIPILESTGVPVNPLAVF